MLFLPIVILVHATTVLSETVCFEGFVMDKFCINRGTLLDASHVTTLENPELHSVHCLVDVSLCWKSGYNILTPNPSGSPKFASAFELDAAGNAMVIELARKTGSKSKGCTSCGTNGQLSHGFRATFFGEKIDNGDGKIATLKVHNISTSPRLLMANGSDGCPTGTGKLNLTLDTSSGSFKNPSIAHGSLMIISWGFLLPTGVSSAKFLKHRPNAFWFKVHRIMQIFGLIVAITGWIVALATFDVFKGKSTSYTHGALGMTVMVLGILQPINAFLRPHPPEKGEKRSTTRLIWEIIHKSSGYIAIILAAVTICFGTFVIFDHKSAFRAAWGVTLGWVFLFSLACLWDGHRYRQKEITHSSAAKAQGQL